MSSDNEIESHKMNHCVVPDFEMDDDYPNIPTSSGITNTTSKKSTIADEELMELIWQNGQVVMQSQNQRSMRKSHLCSEQSALDETVTASVPLFMQEDETASWLQYPLDDSSFERDLYADFLYPTPSSTSAGIAAAPPEEIHASTAEIRPSPPLLQSSVGTISSSSRPIKPQLKCTEGELSHRLQNFGYFSSVGTISSSPRPIIPQLRYTEGEFTDRLRNFEHFSRLPEAISSQNGASSSGHSVRPSTVVESNETPIAAVPEYTVSRVKDSVTPVPTVNVGGKQMAAAATFGGREVTTACEQAVTSSTSASGGSVSASAEPLHPSQKAAHAEAKDQKRKRKRKRKRRESDDNEDQSEDVEFESADAKKHSNSSTSTKRSRAAEVHNRSERRRRDRINEKMRALQELIPRCNKSDKASMLDEAIEYLKSLQLQVQMMSMGCSMVPMMYPGIPQYMQTMGMNVGMGMNMEMGMNRPRVPYPSLVPGPAMQNGTVAAQMAPRYPIPPYHVPPFPAPGPSRIPAANRPDYPMPNSLARHNTNQPRVPNFTDPYHQYFGLQQAQLMLPQASPRSSHSLYLIIAPSFALGIWYPREIYSSSLHSIRVPCPPFSQVPFHFLLEFMCLIA